MGPHDGNCPNEKPEYDEPFNDTPGGKTKYIILNDTMPGVQIITAQYQYCRHAMHLFL